jgi:hypothetical protein
VFGVKKIISFQLSLAVHAPAGWRVRLAYGVPSVYQHFDNFVMAALGGKN